MAIIYVRSTTGSDSNDGLTWATAKKYIQAGIDAAGVGGVVYVSQAHIDYVSGDTRLLYGPTDGFVAVICVNDSAEPPTSVATTAVIRSNYTSSSDLNVVVSGNIYMYGVTLDAQTKCVSFGGESYVSTIYRQTNVKLINCSVKSVTGVNLAGSGTPSGASSEYHVQVDLIHTPVDIGAGKQIKLYKSSTLNWYDTPSAVTGTSYPSALVTLNGNSSFNASGVDFSNVTGAIVLATGLGSATLENCRLGTSIANAVSASFTSVSRPEEARLTNCDSTDTNWKSFVAKPGGTIASDSTVYRSGGASDGTTPISWLMTGTSTSALIGEPFPLYSDEITFWNETIGAPITVTAELTSDTAGLTNAQVWMETEVLGTSGYPVSTWHTTQRGAGLSEPHPLMTATALPASTAAWTGAKAYRYKITATVTPQEKGPVRVRFAVASAGLAVYVDPKVTVS